MSYNAHTTHFTHLKCKIQWFLVSSPQFTVNTINFRTFSTPRKGGFFCFHSWYFFIPVLRWQGWLGGGWRAERPAGGAGGKDGPLLPAGALLGQLLLVLRQGDHQTTTLVTPGQKPSQLQQFEAQPGVLSLSQCSTSALTWKSFPTLIVGGHCYNG